MNYPNSITSCEDLMHLSRIELKKYILSIQSELQQKLNSGKSIDTILDQSDPFEILEPFLSKELYPILVLLMVNNLQSDTVLNPILDALENQLHYNSNTLPK